MLYAKKDNRQVKIQADEKDAFLKQGYTIIEVTGKGKSLKKKTVAAPVNVKNLAKENAKLRKENEALKAQLVAK